VKGFIMSELIWWYIWILVKSYLETGLFVAIVFTIISYLFPSDQPFTLRDFFTVLFFHPIVLYHFIKSLYGDD
jgi:hypothetical protein